MPELAENGGEDHKGRPKSNDIGQYYLTAAEEEEEEEKER